MRLDTGGRLLVGLSSDLSGNSTSTALQVSTIGGGFIGLARNDTSVANGNPIGGLRFYANDPSGYNDVGIVQCVADGTHQTNDYPTRLEFHTTADTASSPTERMRITSSGELLIGQTDESNLNVKLACKAANVGGFFVGTVHDSTNSNNRTTLIHRMDPGSSQGFQFSGNIVIQSFTGNAFVTCHITKLYNNNNVEVDVVHATSSNQVSRVNLRIITCQYGSSQYLGIQKNGGGTGVTYIDGFLNGNIGSHGGIREVNNSSLASVAEQAKLNY